MTKAAHSARRMIECIHVFAGLKEQTLDALAAACVPCRAKKGALVVKEGTPGREMYLIARGGVEVVKAAGSREEVVLAELSAGEFFGEMCIIECRRRSASIRALKPSLLYSLESGDLLHVFQQWPDQYGILIYNIARDLCRRLRTMDDVFAASAF